MLADRCQELVQVTEGFGQPRDAVFLDVVLVSRDQRTGGHDDETGAIVSDLATNAFVQLFAAAVGHGQVAEDEIDAITDESLGFLSATGRDDFVAVSFQSSPEHLSHHLLIINDEDDFGLVQCLIIPPRAEKF